MNAVIIDSRRRVMGDITHHDDIIRYYVIAHWSLRYSRPLHVCTWVDINMMSS